jgi:hypothetical protein
MLLLLAFTKSFRTRNPECPAFCFILIFVFVLGFLLSEKFLSSNAPKQWRERERRAYSAARGPQKES